MGDSFATTTRRPTCRRRENWPRGSVADLLASTTPLPVVGRSHSAVALTAGMAEVQVRVAARRDANGPTKYDQTGTGVDRVKGGAQTVRHPRRETAVVLRFFARFETASRCEMILGVSVGARASRPC